MENENPPCVGILSSALLTIVCGLGSAQAQENYSIQVLHDFEANNPPSSLISAPDGGFYGSTFGGTVFRASLHGVIVTLVSFGSSVGNDPSGLIVGHDHNLYGITTFGTNGDGSIFGISPDNALTVLHVFSGADGSRPWGKLLQATDGNLYGTTTAGGPNFLGTVFQMSPTGSVFSNLYSFSNATGWQAVGGLLETSDGWLYGSTSLGSGSIFKINFTGDLTVVTNLTENTGFGLLHLTLARDGSIWGTASSGGAYNRGTVVKLLTEGLLTVVASFGEEDGSLPRGLIEGADGSFYGVTEHGGKYGVGTVFKVTRQGGLRTVADFDRIVGAFPQGSLAQGGNGKIYGLAWSGGRFGSGTLFRLVQTASSLDRSGHRQEPLQSP